MIAKNSNIFSLQKLTFNEKTQAIEDDKIFNELNNSCKPMTQASREECVLKRNSHSYQPKNVVVTQKNHLDGSFEYPQHVLLEG